MKFILLSLRWILYFTTLLLYSAALYLFLLWALKKIISLEEEYAMEMFFLILCAGSLFVFLGIFLGFISFLLAKIQGFITILSPSKKIGKGILSVVLALVIIAEIFNIYSIEYIAIFSSIIRLSLSAELLFFGLFLILPNTVDDKEWS